MSAVMETIYADAFRKFLSAASEPGGLTRLREQSFALFTQMGFPTVKSEDWKYTNAAPIVSAEWTITPPKLKAPADIDLALLTRFESGRNGFAALNLAFA